MMLRKVFTISSVFISLFYSTTSLAVEHYFMGFGGRAGKFNTGLTFKRFLNSDNNTGMEIDLYYTNVASGGYTAKGFYIKQLPVNIPIIQIPIDFIVGAGINVGYFPYDPQGYYKRVKKEANYYDHSVVTMGLDITAQIEYKIPKVPVTVGIEVVPFYELLNPGPEYVDFGIAIRYVIK